MGFLEFAHAPALSLEARGALWTLLDFEGQTLSAGVVLVLLGSHWREVCEELRRRGCVRVESVRDSEGAEAYRFRVAKTVAQRRRERDRARKAQKAGHA